MTDIRSKVYIIAVAVRVKGNQGYNIIVSLPKPGRHGDILNYLHRDGYVPAEQDQGFLTNEGNFVGRYEAMRIAVEAGQLLPETGDRPRLKALYSENLW